MTQIIQNSQDRFNTLVRSTLEFQDEDFELETDEEYARVLEHIEKHTYFVNRIIPVHSPRDGVYSWYQRVYEPIMSWIDRLHLYPYLQNDSGLGTRGQLYLAICDHWHYLQENGKRKIHPKKAVYSFALHRITNPWVKLLFRLRRKMVL